MRTIFDVLPTILPPNSTKLEKDLLSIAPFDGILDPAVKDARFAKGYWRGWKYQSDVRELPARDEDGNFIADFDGPGFVLDGDGKPVLDQNNEYVLDDTWPRRLLPINDTFYPSIELESGSFRLLPFIEDPQQRILAAYFLRDKAGTPLAVKKSLEWINFPGTHIVEETAPTVHFPEYQLILTRAPSVTEVGSIVNVVLVSQPLRSRLRRLVFGWDIPKLVLDESPWEDIWDSYSGETVTQLDSCPQAVGLITSIRNRHDLPRVKIPVQYQINHETITP
jgi:hypothetical protein